MKTNLHSIHTQNKCLYQIYLFMTILNLLKIPGKTNYSVNTPGAQILFGYDCDQSFDNPRIKNHSVTAPSAQILFGDYD